ncbi:hypothetical protein AVEN_224931-1 [Araneus ventricosus]|uniref:Uncharacterized protein n=1 Tax=Araneus ventricosus TaxID=182803 RepID=A0A4Y2SM41_ARAVE|nr:hypothetical protein AVEN_224931-1 [Araneus ventricosus]
MVVLIEGRREVRMRRTKIREISLLILRFPSYLFRFGIHPDNCCACGEPGTPFHYATKCRLTLSYHLKCPADQHKEAWLKSITNHRLLRNKIIDLLNFITSQEHLLKSEHPE